MTSAQIAAVAHEANRAYCVEIGDDSQPPWGSAPEWQRESARVGVEAIISGKARSPETSHEGWLALKVKEGWVYGGVKDPEAKTHPCMLPYRDLPEKQQHKDALFVSVVFALLPLFDG